jgi:hypothetical protein
MFYFRSMFDHNGSIKKALFILIYSHLKLLGRWEFLQKKWGSKFCHPILTI